MHKLFFLIALLICCAYGQTSGGTDSITPSCDNLLFKERLGEFWDDILYLSTPEPFSGDSPTCKFHFAEGDPQCCNDVVYDLILRVWIKVRVRIAVAVTLAKSIRQAWINAREKFRPVRNDVDKAYERGDITQVQHDALIDFINRVLAAWDTFIDRLIDNWARCLVAILKYWAGIICLGCDPEWEKYIYEDVLGHLHLRLTEETCNEIRGECLPVWQLIYDFITSLQDALNSLREDLSLEPVDYGNDQICNGDCGAWLCAAFFGGRDAQDGTLPAPGDGTTKRNADKIEAVFKHFESQVTAAYHPHTNGPAFVESVSELLKTTHSAFKAFEQVHRQTSGATNDYGDDGYNPIEVGANSGLNMKVDTGSASGLSSWLRNLL